MASADGMLYWSDDDRRIWRVSASGGAPLLLRASDVVGSVVAVTVAGPYLVFIEQEPGFPQQGRILRVAR